MKLKRLFSHDWSEVTNGARNKVVFEQLNKSYGAYEIRINYGATVIKAFSILTILITISLICILLSRYFNPMPVEIPIPSDSPIFKPLVFENPAIPEEPKKSVKAIAPVRMKDTEPKIIDDPEKSQVKIESDQPNINIYI